MIPTNMAKEPVIINCKKKNKTNKTNTLNLFYVDIGK